MSLLPQLTETELKLLAASFGVIGTVLGILLGAGVQSVTNSINRRRERRAVIQFGYELVINIRSMVSEFKEFESLTLHIAFKTVLPKLLEEELDFYLDWSRKTDSSVAINTMWLKQAILNLTGSLNALKQDVIDRTDNQRSPVSKKSNSVLAVSSDAYGALRYCDYLLWHFFWHGGWGVRLKILRRGMFWELKTTHADRPVR
jgi:type II secretory pathway pseudopilin PulG